MMHVLLINGTELESTISILFLETFFQTARSVVTNQDMVTQMIKDISSVDFVDICSQAGFMDPSSNPKFCMKMQNCKYR